ncbi:hypothetical protein [Bradyrhizobium sp. Tv2a-2]|uniref:hypothetical protein n=1 Tax=Bradyrhizobium sp. Tv2a-2 TaxID=113395 RepID=UPI000425134F|nr:hypothetical protein [Bradyrhizobium sp. Tv2a-2]
MGDDGRETEPVRAETGRFRRLIHPKACLGALSIARDDDALLPESLGCNGGFALDPDDWLAKFDASRGAIEAVFRNVDRDDTLLWMLRWRWFFLATSGLLGHDEGRGWSVDHWRLLAAD